MASLPPTRLRTAYDETLRSKFYGRPSIHTLGDRPSIIGILEQHSLATDGTFSVCTSAGQGVFISKELLDSIPAPHRPQLDTTYQPEVLTHMSGTPKAIGTTFFPFVLTNQKTKEKFRIVLHAIVVPNMFTDMVIGIGGGELVKSAQWEGGMVWALKLGQGDDDLTYIQGV